MRNKLIFYAIARSIIALDFTHIKTVFIQNNKNISSIPQQYLINNQVAKVYKFWFITKKIATHTHKIKRVAKSEVK